MTTMGSHDRSRVVIPRILLPAAARTARKPQEQLTAMRNVSGQQKAERMRAIQAIRVEIRGDGPFRIAPALDFPQAR